MDVASDDVLDRWTSTVVLGDGDTAVVRPILPSDQHELAEFHARQSPESRYRRYFSPKPTLTDEELERFTTVDFVDRAAFVVETHGEFVAWASYERWANRADAEVAFMVDDDHHGKGIATLLLEHLAAVARHNGVTRFTAQTLGDNRAMLTVFAKAGWPVHRRFESGVIDVDFPLADTTEFIDSVERREQRADSRAVARLLLPSSIAVVGASDEDRSVGRALWRHVSTSVRCPVYAVNPNRATVGGVPTHATVVDIPDEVGLAVIAVPSTALAATIEQCIEKRVRGAIVVTVADPADLDIGELVARARRAGLRIIGPASMGIASPRPDVVIQAALANVALPPGRVAISMQSGTLGSSLLRLADSLQLGLSWFVSLGDKRDVSANDLLQFWEDDDATSVIALYTESFGNPRKFSRIARRVAATKPIVAVRTGAALVGSGNDALYRQTGVIEVPTVTALLDTARVLASQPPLRGRRVAIVSNSRSPQMLAGATLEEADLEVVRPPVALDWRSPSDAYRSAITAALADDGIDGLMVIHAPPVAAAVGQPVDEIDAACAGATKPVVAVMLGSGDGPLRAGSDVPCFAFPEQAAAVLGRIAAWWRWRHEEADDGDAAPARIDPALAGAIIAEHLDEGTMSPSVVRELLASYGIEMPPSRLVPADDAVSTADAIGYPVAVKAAVRRRVGRSAEAGIALDLTDPDDVAEVVELMRRHLGGDARQVLVQQMVPPGLDLRVRVTVDDRIGPIITTGLGGVQAEAIADEESRLAPISPTVARTLVSTTRAAALLDDAALDRAADVVSRVAQLASDHPEIVELDLNPVIVGESGCSVADATIAIAAPSRPEGAIRRLE